MNRPPPPSQTRLLSQAFSLGIFCHARLCVADFVIAGGVVADGGKFDAMVNH